MSGPALGRRLGAGSTGRGWPPHVPHDPDDLAGISQLVPVGPGQPRTPCWSLLLWAEGR